MVLQQSPPLVPFENIRENVEKSCHLDPRCYKSRLKGLSQETTLVLSNTREFDRVSNTK